MKYKIEKVTDLKYANKENTKVNLNVKFKDSDEVFPFTTDTDDLELHGIELHIKAMTGKYGAVAPYIAPVVSPEIKLKKDLDTIGLSDDLENIIDAMDEESRNRISSDTLDKYRMKKTLKNQ